jgi:hypothetical protein
MARLLQLNREIRKPSPAVHPAVALASVMSPGLNGHHANCVLARGT